jgi:hypothetical protein
MNEQYERVGSAEPRNIQGSLGGTSGERLPVDWTSNDRFDETTCRADVARCCASGVKSDTWNSISQASRIPLDDMSKTS